MKKVKAFIAVVLSVCLILTGCSSYSESETYTQGNSTTNATTKTASESTAKSEFEMSYPDPVSFFNCEYEVSEDGTIIVMYSDYDLTDAVSDYVSIAGNYRFSFINAADTLSDDFSSATGYILAYSGSEESGEIIIHNYGYMENIQNADGDYCDAWLMSIELCQLQDFETVTIDAYQYSTSKESTSTVTTSATTEATTSTSKETTTATVEDTVVAVEIDESYFIQNPEDFFGAAAKESGKNSNSIWLSMKFETKEDAKRAYDDYCALLAETFTETSSSMSRLRCFKYTGDADISGYYKDKAGCNIVVDILDYSEFGNLIQITISNELVVLDLGYRPDTAYAVVEGNQSIDEYINGDDDGSIYDSIYTEYYLGSKYVLDGDVYEVQVGDSFTLYNPRVPASSYYAYTWDVVGGDGSIVTLDRSGSTCLIVADAVGTVTITANLDYSLQGIGQYNYVYEFTVVISERTSTNTKSFGSVADGICPRCHGNKKVETIDGLVECPWCHGSGKWTN